ncbi:MAG: hypothetical protein PHP23_08635 [Desulfobacterales bacterium]|nr:hypothetical protein [Desulfobacterales bacterium]
MYTRLPSPSEGSSTKSIADITETPMVFSLIPRPSSTSRCPSVVAP